MLNKQFFTSESMMEGHSDKICDQISDAILDAVLAQDSDVRVTCEACCAAGMVMVTGEISTSRYVDILSTARSVALEIGYDRAKYGFDGTICSVLTFTDEQPKDIAFGVDHLLGTKEGGEENNGAGDQETIFGYAYGETPEYMPMPIFLARRLTRRLTEVRKDGTLDYLHPGGKTQVIIEYESDHPKRVDTVVISAQHPDTVSLDMIRKDLKKHVVDVIVDTDTMDAETKVYVNPAGCLAISGPQGDNGLTGRKIVVDTYGSMACHGGKALSGKGPTKIDRSAACAACYVAKDIVAVGSACKCEIQLAYVIDAAQPVSALADTSGTGVLPDEEITETVREEPDLRPTTIIRTLELRKPIHRSLAAYGCLSRDDPQVKWESTGPAERLKVYVK